MQTKQTKQSDELSDAQKTLQSRLYKSVQSKSEFLALYDALLETWEVEYTSRYVSTEFGDTHIIETKPAHQDNPGLEPLLLIPGGQGTAAMWGPLVPTLGANRRVFSIDLIDQPGRSYPQRVLENSKDANRWLTQTLDALAVDQVHLMGNSIGSFIATKFAISNPERVSRLVLTAPAATFASVRVGYIFRVLWALSSPLKKSKEKFVTLNANGRIDQNDPLNRVLVGAMSGTRVLSKLSPSFLSDDEIGAFEVPTLVIFGERDHVNGQSSAHTMAKLARINPEIRTTLVKEAGHLFTPDDFRYCAKLANEFLQENLSEQ